MTRTLKVMVREDTSIDQQKRLEAYWTISWRGWRPTEASKNEKTRERTLVVRSPRMAGLVGCWGDEDVQCPRKLKAAFGGPGGEAPFSSSTRGSLRSAVSIIDGGCSCVILSCDMRVLMVSGIVAAARKATSSRPSPCDEGKSGRPPNGHQGTEGVCMDLPRDDSSAYEK